MKKFNLKLVAATLITTMLIPMGAVSAAEKPNKSNKGYEVKISQQLKNANVKDESQASSKWSSKIEKAKAKAEWMVAKEKAKLDVKLAKQAAKLEVKKTREEVKAALKEQKTVITQNNDKLQDLREEVIDQKKEVTEVISYIKTNNIVISDDVSKQITDRLEMIKADIEALNSSKGTIENIYVDIKAQLEKKDAEAVQTGIDNVLAIQEQRYLSLQKLHDDLQVLLNLLNQVKATAQTQTPAPGTTVPTTPTTTTPATGTSTDGQAPAAGSGTTTQTGTDTTTTPATTPVDSSTAPTQTTTTQTPTSGI